MFEFRGAYCIDYRNFANLSLIRNPLGQKSYFLKLEILACQDYKKRSLLPPDDSKCASPQAIAEVTGRTRMLIIYQNQLIDANLDNPVNRFTRTQTVSFMEQRRKVIQFDVESSVAQVTKGMFSYLSKDSKFNFVGSARPERLVPDVRQILYNSESAKPDGLVRLDIKLNIQKRVYKASRPLFEEFVYDLGSIVMIGCLIIWAVVIPLNKKMFCFALARSLNKKQLWLSEFEKQEMKILEDYSELRTLAQTQSNEHVSMKVIVSKQTPSSSKFKYKAEENESPVMASTTRANLHVPPAEDDFLPRREDFILPSTRLISPQLDALAEQAAVGNGLKDRKQSDELEMEVNDSMSKPQVNSSQGISVISSHKHKFGGRDQPGSQKDSKRSLQSLKNYNRSKFSENVSESNGGAEMFNSNKRVDIAPNMSMENAKKDRESENTPSSKKAEKIRAAGSPSFRPIMGFPLESDKNVKIIHERDIEVETQKKRKRQASSGSEVRTENSNQLDLKFKHRKSDTEQKQADSVSAGRDIQTGLPSKISNDLLVRPCTPEEPYPPEFSPLPNPEFDRFEQTRQLKFSSGFGPQQTGQPCKAGLYTSPVSAGLPIPSLGMLDQNASMSQHHSPVSMKQSLEVGYSNYLKCHVKTKRLFKKATGYFEDITILDLVSDKFWPCLLKQKGKSRNAVKSMAELGYTLDAGRIVESLNTLDKLLRVLFTSDQLLLFESIPNYERRHFNSAETELTIERLLETGKERAKKLKQAATRTFLKGSKSELDEHLLNHCYHLVDETVTAEHSSVRPSKQPGLLTERRSPHPGRR